jgi:hypothetical protein
VTTREDRNSFFAMFRRRLEQRPLRTNLAIPRDAGRQVSSPNLSSSLSRRQMDQEGLCAESR